jgi:cobalt-precorrin 5A hydrolase
MVVIGLGARRGVAAEALLAAVEAATERLPEGIAAEAIATAAFKRGEPAFAALAQRLALPLHFVERKALEVASAGANPSPAALAHVGLSSVAEASALAAAGPGARLIVPRLVAGSVICAIARGGL